MKVWLSIALGMHGAVAGAIALGAGEPASQPGAPPPAEYELLAPAAPAPTVEGSPIAPAPTAPAIARAAAPAVPVGHAASAAASDPAPASAPDSVASAPSAPPRFSLAVSASAPGSVSASSNGPGSSGAGTGSSDSLGAAPAPPPPAAIVESRDVTTPARVYRSATPAYPLAAREDGVEATVKLEIVVDETGHVLSARVMEGAGHGFDEAALQALQSYSFTPARVGQRVVRVRMPWSVEFRLR